MTIAEGDVHIPVVGPTIAIELLGDEYIGGWTSSS